VSGRTLHLYDALAASVLQAAARAYPFECCGLIEGVTTEEGWEALAVHEAANIAPNPARAFVIDPQIQFDLMRLVRGTKRRLIGCFHSHPGGAPEPSADDLAQAYEADFLYVIAGGDPAVGFVLKAYAFDDVAKAFDKVALKA
jgi:proteasome lid subunit RPN8/RPN11